MLLNEFFNHAIDIGKNQKQKDRDNPKLGDDLFWYILDHDKLHKDYFFEIADKIKNLDIVLNDRIKSTSLYDVHN